MRKRSCASLAEMGLPVNSSSAANYETVNIPKGFYTRLQGGAYLVSSCGDHAWNPALARDDPPRGLGEGKRGALPRDDDVAVADELCAAAEAEPIHGGDERFGERPPSGDARKPSVPGRKRCAARCSRQPPNK